jgi:hypothetical protein
MLNADKEGRVHFFIILKKSTECLGSTGDIGSAVF